MTGTRMLSVFLVFAGIVQGQVVNHRKNAELAGIVKRGRAIAEYNMAIRDATNSLHSNYPDQTQRLIPVGTKLRAGWQVAFGDLAQDGREFEISYVATQAKKHGQFAVSHLTPTRKDDGPDLSFARAIRFAQQDLHGMAGHYESAAISSDSMGIDVYLTRAQPKNSVTIGEDFLYHFSSDGATLLEKKQLHSEVLEFARLVPSTKEAGACAGYVCNANEVPDVVSGGESPRVGYSPSMSGESPSRVEVTQTVVVPEPNRKLPFETDVAFAAMTGVTVSVHTQKVGYIITPKGEIGAYPLPGNR